jgi:hypothetical protein
MALSVFPPAIAVDTVAKTLTTPTANTVLYTSNQTFSPYVYRITCTSSSVARFQFMDGSGNIIVSGETTSGTVDVNLGSTASSIRYWSDTSNLIINIAIVGSSISGSSFTGTLDTITSTTSSYNYGTSTKAYVIVVGGGGCGKFGNPGMGGGSGGVNGQYVSLSGTIAVTIGAGATVNSNANGGTTTFGLSTPIVATGGLSGLNGGTGGTPNGKNGNSGTAAPSPYSFVVNGSTGPGGSYPGTQYQVGSGIGTGGGGNETWNSASGYGSGGGAWDQSGYSGHSQPGVVYVFRF